jgi:hypothetical protein
MFLKGMKGVFLLIRSESERSEGSSSRARAFTSDSLEGKRKM